MDCTAKCRLSYHADVVLSAVTKETLQDLQYFVKYFCGNGAQTRDRFGRNALHIAASCGRKDVLQWLLEEKLFDVNEKDFESGWTALHRACYYGHLSCALLLLQHGANIYEQDFEGLTPIEMLMLDCPRLYISQSPDVHLDVYSWGRNSNFTLGHGDDKERNIPEVVDVFTRMLHISIKEVVLCKFHAVFLANNGSVWTCGHGLGGRLGHGDEKTILVPTKIDALNDQVCCGIAAGQDHTVVLCENGNVFTFGLNKYHQLGHHPPATQYLSPKPVLTKTLKGKKFIGVAAGKFHTIMFTESEVYSWGLNAGQLGHIKGDRTQVLPRQISGLYLKNTSILAVNCCDAATVFLTSHGDVYLAYQYTLRRIISKLPNIKKLVATGGRLDDNHFKELKDVKFGVLTVYGLYGDGYVFQWRENDKYLRDCRWSIKKPLSIRDIACGKSLHMVTEQGEVYTEDGTSASEKKPVKISIRSDNVIKTNQAIKQDEVIEIPLGRVRHCHRAVRIVSDKYSQNVAILQVVPSFGCSVIPHVSPPEMKENMRRLLEDAPESSDVKIQVKEKTIHAHQVILAQSSEKFETLMNESQSSHFPVISLDEEDFEIINEVVEFLYTGCCTLLSALDGENCELEKELTDEDILDELALSVHDLDIDLLDAVFSEPRVVKQGKKSRRFKKSLKDVENKEEWRKVNSDHCSKELLEKRKELLRVAKKYRITQLISRLQDSSDDNGIKPRSFHRNKLSDYCDVVIEAEDGVDFSCHKCILVSRLEYFSMMLSTGWMESSEEFLYLKMPSRVLKVIIEFLYTDEAPSVKDSKDLEFLGKILSFADQFLIIRLREMCEARLASLITLKNAVEMLEFSCVFNAKNLKSVCLEFLCMNISYVFESGNLEMLSEDVLDEVSKAYREIIPRVAWRVITPNDIHLSVPRPQPESPKSKRKSSRSQRRSRASESDVTEERAAQETGTEISEPAKEKIEVAKKLSENQQNVVNGQHDDLPLESKSENVSSSPEVILDQGKKSEKTELWYKKPRDDCSKFFSPLLAAKKVQKTGSNSLSTGGRSKDEPDEKQPWGSPSPESSNLRAIMEQQQSKVQLDKPKKEGKSPLSNKTRISQKERKKMRRSFEEQETVFNNACEPEQNGHNIAISPVNPWNNVSPSAKPSVSFRALLEEEKRLGTNVSSIKKKTVKQNLFVSDEKSKTTSAWQHGNIACSPPNDSNMKFDKIQELQEEETAKRERDMKKPLSLIQIEDKAIEQLMEYYGGRYNPCEYIVVKRETRTAGSPDWVK